jgi:hypothetical protein
MYMTPTRYSRPTEFIELKGGFVEDNLLEDIIVTDTKQFYQI